MPAKKPSMEMVINLMFIKGGPPVESTRAIKTSDNKMKKKRNSLSPEFSGNRAFMIQPSSRTVRMPSETKYRFKQIRLSRIINMSLNLASR
jgi:hypothetical protein